MAGLTTRGAAAEWGDLFAGARRVALPTYAFQRRHYWLTSTGERSRRTGDPVSDVDGWRHVPVWREEITPDPVLAGTWVVVGAESEVVLAAIGEHGGEPRRAELDPAGVDQEALADRLRAAGEPAGVVAVLDGVPLAGVVALIKAVVDVGARLWCLTNDPLVRGVALCAAVEHPEHWGGLVELAEDASPRALARALGTTGRRLAVRGDRLLAWDLEPVGATGPSEPVWRPSGTVLVSAVTAGEGGPLVRWLLDNGAAKVVLAVAPGRARSAPTRPSRSSNGTRPIPVRWAGWSTGSGSRPRSISAAWATIGRSPTWTPPSCPISPRPWSSWPLCPRWSW